MAWSYRHVCVRVCAGGDAIRKNKEWYSSSIAALSASIICKCMGNLYSVIFFFFFFFAFLYFGQELPKQSCEVRSTKCMSLVEFTTNYTRNFQNSILFFFNLRGLSYLIEGCNPWKTKCILKPNQEYQWLHNWLCTAPRHWDCDSCQPKFKKKKNTEKIVVFDEFPVKF